MNLITCADFARRMRITDRAARSAFAKAEWRGHKLPVTPVQGKRGGAGGACWVLHVELCPPELRALLAGDETAVSTTIEAPLYAHIGDRQVAVARDRQRIIAPILKTSPGSAERAQAFRDIAARPAHQIAGTLRPVAERTLRDWVEAAERKGTAAILPKVRSDHGARRVQITRAWDASIGLDEATRTKLSADIERLACSMVANDGTSTREVLRLCSDHLARISAKAGSPLLMKQLRRACALNPKWAKRISLDRFRLAHMHDKDHKTWQDKAVPRVCRDLHDTPMGLLIGDVHYVDMLVEEGDQEIRVRLIAWIDAASMFAWVTPVFLAPRIGIRQEDVAESLAQVVLCPHGGIPQNFYLDNGSEYSEVASTVMIRLAHLAEADFGVTLARPYSPTSKGEIEGFFNIIEGIFKGLPGWIGGDRTNKKTANKGKVVAPYRDGIAALEADIQAAVSIYNDRPQSGRLQGLSPVQMLERKIADTVFAAGAIRGSIRPDLQ